MFADDTKTFVKVSKEEDLSDSVKVRLYMFANDTKTFVKVSKEEERSTVLCIDVCPNFDSVD